MEPQKYVRHTAIKCTVGSILEGTYVQGSENEMSYVLLEEQKMYRANIFGILVLKEGQGAITNMMIDDGTGRIIVRSFEESVMISRLNVGEIVVVIGKVRTYNNERYISPEIMKKIDQKWMKVRQKEVVFRKPMNEEKSEKELVKVAEEKIEKLKVTEEVIPKNEGIVQEEEIHQETILPAEKVVTIIRELDDGSGVLVEDIIEKSPLRETEKVIEKMLERGEIFQNQPGKVKVL